MSLLRRLLDWFLGLMEPAPLRTEEDEAEVEAYRRQPNPKEPFSRPGRWRSGL